MDRKDIDKLIGKVVAATTTNETWISTFRIVGYSGSSFVCKNTDTFSSPLGCVPDRRHDQIFDTFEKMRSFVNSELNKMDLAGVSLDDSKDVVLKKDETTFLYLVKHGGGIEVKKIQYHGDVNRSGEWFMDFRFIEKSSFSLSNGVYVKGTLLPDNFYSNSEEGRNRLMDDISVILNAHSDIKLRASETSSHNDDLVVSKTKGIDVSKYTCIKMVYEGKGYASEVIIAFDRGTPKGYTTDTLDKNYGFKVNVTKKEYDRIIKDLNKIDKNLLIEI